MVQTQCQLHTMLNEFYILQLHKANFWAKRNSKR